MLCGSSEHCDDAGDCGYAGNFRGVCPIIGRLRMLFLRVYRVTMGQYRPFCAGIFYEWE